MEFTGIINDLFVLFSRAMEWLFPAYRKVECHIETSH